MRIYEDGLGTVIVKKNGENLNQLFSLEIKAGLHNCDLNNLGFSYGYGELFTDTIIVIANDKEISKAFVSNTGFDIVLENYIVPAGCSVKLLFKAKVFEGIKSTYLFKLVGVKSSAKILYMFDCKE